MASSLNHRYVTLALSKGKLLSPALAYLKRLDVTVPFTQGDDRRLIFDIPESHLRILLVRATDVPTYVEHGVADMGIAGGDLLLEQVRDVYTRVDLRFGVCRLVLAEPQQKKKRLRHPLRIATKYPNLTEQYFAEKGIPIEMIKLYGSIELAPLVGLADQIVDLTESGATLRANGLVIKDTILECSAQLIVNRAALKRANPPLLQWIEAFKQ